MSVVDHDAFHGPYWLDDYEETLHKGEIGVYVFLDAEGEPRYVGRSDSDLAVRLRSWAGVYETFLVEYHTSPRNAYYRECELHHEFESRLDNDIHPAVPKGTNWRCPVKGCPWS